MFLCILDKLSDPISLEPQCLKKQIQISKYSVKVFLDKLAYHSVTGNAFISGPIKELTCEASFTKVKTIKVEQKRNRLLFVPL